MTSKERDFDVQSIVRDHDGRCLTRDGRKARIVMTDLKNSQFPVVAVIENPNRTGGGEDVQTYTASGAWGLHTFPHDLDLVQPEKTVTLYVNVYKDSSRVQFSAFPHLTKERADDAARDHTGIVRRIACVPIDVEV